MLIIAKHAAGKVLKQDNLQLSTEAKLAKKSDPKTINATAGMFFYDDIFQGFKTVDKILKSLKDEEFYAYSPSDGGSEFKEVVLNWVFDIYLPELKISTNIHVLATPGGTGAIFSSLFNSLDPGETVLFPYPYWAPYLGIANNLGFKTKTFPLFSGNSFNLAGFKEAADALIKEQGKLVTILNDPCNNPTGYSLSEAELREIIAYLNNSGAPCILIYDIAYLDFADEDQLKYRKNFKILSEAGNNVLISIAFSASKTFSVYGQRLGAQIIMSKNETEALEFYNASNFTARNTWSNVNKGLINFLVKFDQDKKIKKQFLDELTVVKGIIKERANIFLREAESVGLLTHPYQSGFFVSIPVANRDAVLDALINEEKIYLIPCTNSVRLAFCSVPAVELKGLAERIKKVIDKTN